MKRKMGLSTKLSCSSQKGMELHSTNTNNSLAEEDHDEVAEVMVTSSVSWANHGHHHHQLHQLPATKQQLRCDVKLVVTKLLLYDPKVC